MSDEFEYGTFDPDGDPPSEMPPGLTPDMLRFVEGCRMLAGELNLSHKEVIMAATFVIQSALACTREVPHEPGDDDFDGDDDDDDE